MHTHTSTSAMHSSSSSSSSSSSDLCWGKNKTPTPTVSSRVTETRPRVSPVQLFPCYICLLLCPKGKMSHQTVTVVRKMKRTLVSEAAKAPAITTSEQCTSARSFPRTEQSRAERTGGESGSPRLRSAREPSSTTTPSRTKKFSLLQGRRAKEGVPEELASGRSSALWSSRKERLLFFVASRGDRHLAGGPGPAPRAESALARGPEEEEERRSVRPARRAPAGGPRPSRRAPLEGEPLRAGAGGRPRPPPRGGHGCAPPKRAPTPRARLLRRLLTKAGQRPPRPAQRPCSCTRRPRRRRRRRRRGRRGQGGGEERSGRRGARRRRRWRRWGGGSGRAWPGGF